MPQVQNGHAWETGLDAFKNGSAQLRLEFAGHLVDDEKPRRMGQRPCQHDAALLPSAQFPSPFSQSLIPKASGHTFESTHRQKPLIRRLIQVFAHDRHVVIKRSVKQRVFLGHKTNLIRRSRRQRHRPARNGIKSKNTARKRRFAATRWQQNRVLFPLAEHQRKIVPHDACAKRKRQVINAQHLRPHTHTKRPAHRLRQTLDVARPGAPLNKMLIGSPTASVQKDAPDTPETQEERRQRHHRT